MEQVELLLRKAARSERKRARLSTSRREREVREDLISRINVALFNFKSEAHFTSQTWNKLREKNPALLSLALKSICTLRIESALTL